MCAMPTEMKAGANPIRAKPKTPPWRNKPQAAVRHFADDPSCLARRTGLLPLYFPAAERRKHQNSLQALDFPWAPTSFPHNPPVPTNAPGRALAAVSDVGYKGCDAPPRHVSRG